MGFSSLLYELLVPWPTSARPTRPRIQGSVAALGQLAATIGRVDEAAGHFEEAVAMNERMGLRPWLARTRSDYAALLLARNDPGDQERAGALLDAAHSAFRELGVEPV